MTVHTVALVVAFLMCAAVSLAASALLIVMTGLIPVALLLRLDQGAALRQRRSDA